MEREIAIAAKYIVSHLYNKLPRRRVDCFGEALNRGIRRKFDGHWYPEQPFKGSAFRCVKVSGNNADSLIDDAAAEVGLPLHEVQRFLPDEMTLWVDPLEVSCRVGEKGVVRVIYSAHPPHNADVTGSFLAIDSLSSALAGARISPLEAATPANPWSQAMPPQQQVIMPQPQMLVAPRQQQEQVFTAAMFAQTKFGSTKLRSGAKRPNRLTNDNTFLAGPPPQTSPQHEWRRSPCFLPPPPQQFVPPPPAMMHSPEQIFPPSLSPPARPSLSIWQPHSPPFTSCSDATTPASDVSSPFDSPTTHQAPEPQVTDLGLEDLVNQLLGNDTEADDDDTGDYWNGMTSSSYPNRQHLLVAN